MEKDQGWDRELKKNVVFSIVSSFLRWLILCT